MGDTSDVVWHTKDDVTEAWEGGERKFTFKVRRRDAEGVTGWRIGFGGSNILVAEGSAYGIHFGKALFDALVAGEMEFPGGKG